jgi:hypothetical protein
MTIILVPTSTPIPIVEIKRSCDCDRLTASGNIPAPNDLHSGLVFEGTAGLQRRRGSYAAAIKTQYISRVKSPSGMLVVKSRGAGESEVRCKEKSWELQREPGAVKLRFANRKGNFTQIGLIKNKLPMMKDNLEKQKPFK